MFQRKVLKQDATGKQVCPGVCIVQIPCRLHSTWEENMKRLSVFVSVLVMLFVVSGAYAVDESAISNNVDAIVASIEKGTDVTTIKADSVEPYVFVMEENGKMLVHPTLAGESLKEKAPPVYDALMKASPEGVWVEYEWTGKLKHTYAKKTSGNLIVGSGY